MDFGKWTAPERTGENGLQEIDCSAQHAQHAHGLQKVDQKERERERERAEEEREQRERERQS